MATAWNPNPNSDVRDDRAAAFAFTTRALARHQPDVGGEFAGWAEAPKVVQFGDGRPVILSSQ